jgi:hypothetical protein
VHAHATIDYANVQQEKATLVDLAADGMSVRFGKKLPPTSKVYFQFKLPGQDSNVRLSGQLIWQDWNGRGGVQFVDVPKASRRLLTDFLAVNLPADGQKDQFSDVTVEVEEPMQMAGVAVGSQSHEGGTQTQTAHGHAAVSGAAQSNPDNRRAQTRYSCRLGAEVYLTGTAVPNHCCLTDLSSGGCYLEVPIPFPPGSSVEILVRTYEMKLRLRGVVQASHPGYGMGVAFVLDTREERDNVRTLTSFVAASSESSN